MVPLPLKMLLFNINSNNISIKKLIAVFFKDSLAMSASIVSTLLLMASMAVGDGDVNEEEEEEKELRKEVMDDYFNHHNNSGEYYNTSDNDDDYAASYDNVTFFVKPHKICTMMSLRSELNVS